MYRKHSGTQRSGDASVNVSLPSKETQRSGQIRRYKRTDILQFVKKIRRIGREAKNRTDYMMYSSFDKNRNIHDQAIGDILSLIKNSVLVEESKAKADKKDYDKAYRFYVPVKTQDGIFAVRLVALHDKNNQSLRIEGDIYDAIIEDTPIPNHQLNDSARDRLTISIEEMLQNVKDAEGNPYIYTRNSAAAQLSTLQTGVSTSGMDSSSFAKRVSNARSTNPGTLSIVTKEKIVKGPTFSQEIYDKNGQADTNSPAFKK